MGFAGSLHCAGMCSPLAMAVTSMRSPAFINRVLYNLGRISMYGVLGSIMATIGYVLPISRYQNITSLALAFVLISMALVGVSDLKIPYLTSFAVRVTARIKSIFSRFIQHKTPAAMVLLGSLNGLLPCGLSFLALSLAVTMASPVDGFLYMFTFGIGTLPVMLGVVSVANIVSIKLKWNMKSITSGLMIVSGILLIARVFLVHNHEGLHEHETLVDIVICR